MEKNMKNKSLALCFAFCLFVAMAPGLAYATPCGASSGNLVANCGFETGDFTGWTLSGNDVPNELGNLYGVEGTDPLDGISPNSGSFHAFIADLDSNATTLAQTLHTKAGDLYDVSFYLAQDTTPSTQYSNELIVDFGATTLVSLNAMPVQGYTLYTFAVAATSTSTPISFTIGNGLGETLLDDVKVTDTVAPTPEPSTWSLFLLGGFVLLLAQKRRSYSRAL
jgi:hypothetical protein